MAKLESTQYRVPYYIDQSKSMTKWHRPLFGGHKFPSSVSKMLFKRTSEMFLNCQDFGFLFLIQADAGVFLEETHTTWIVITASFK